MEVNNLMVIVGLAVLVIGPGGSVYVGLRAAQRSERELREMGLQTMERSSARIELVLRDVLGELKQLNHRVTVTEVNVAGLERREGK
jgi:hypothetical protein